MYIPSWHCNLVKILILFYRQKLLQPKTKGSKSLYLGKKKTFPFERVSQSGTFEKCKIPRFLYFLNLHNHLLFYIPFFICPSMNYVYIYIRFWGLNVSKIKIFECLMKDMIVRSRSVLVCIEIICVCNACIVSSSDFGKF